MSKKSLSIDQGQRMVRSSPCYILSSCHFWWVVVSDHWSNGNYTCDLRRVFPSERTAGVSSRSLTVTKKSNSLTYTVASSFVCTYAYLLGSPPQTSLSSDYIVDGKLHSSVGEKCVAFALFFELTDVASLLSFSLLLRSVLKFYRAGIALMRNFDLYFIQRWTIVSRIFAWRSAALVNRTRRIGPNTFAPFRKIIEDSGGSVSCNTQPNCRTSFAGATALLSPLFFGFFFGCSSTIQCENEHLSPNLHPDFSFIELTFGRMPVVTR